MKYELISTSYIEKSSTRYVAYTLSNKSHKSPEYISLRYSPQKAYIINPKTDGTN